MENLISREATKGAKLAKANKDFRSASRCALVRRLTVELFWYRLELPRLRAEDGALSKSVKLILKLTLYVSQISGQGQYPNYDLSVDQIWPFTP
jgi:hypothetical protein